MASDRTREQLITQFAKAIQGIISDQTNHDISVGTLEEEVRYNVLPLLDAFERETRLDELNRVGTRTGSKTYAAWVEKRIAELAAQPTPEVKK